MEMKFTNNSVSGINRRYRGFNFELAGHASAIINVPAQYAANLTAYLKENHPAVVIEEAEAKKSSAGAKPVIDPESTSEKTFVPETTGADVGERGGKVEFPDKKNKKDGGNKK